MFIEASFTIVKKAETSQIYKERRMNIQSLVYSYNRTLLTQTTTWMNLENVILMWNEPGTKSHILYDSIYTNFFRLDKSIEKLDEWLPGPGERGNREWWVMVWWFRGSDENVLELDRGNCCTAHWIYKRYGTVHFKRMNPICKLYFNKAVILKKKKKKNQSWEK